MAFASLQELGFSEKEIKVYLFIVKQGKITPAQLARGVRLNRTTVYAIVKSLVAKGIVIQDVSGTSLRLLPAPPDELKKLLRNAEDEFVSRKNAINQLIEDSALAHVGATYTVPKIRFIEDDGVEDYLYNRFPKWIESMEKVDSTWWGFQDHTFAEQYKKWIDWSWKRSPQGVSLKLLSNKSPIEERLRGKYARREIKFWHKADNFTATTWIGGDYIVMIMTRERPFYLVEIHDAVMAHNMRETFKNIWSVV